MRLTALSLLLFFSFWTLQADTFAQAAAQPRDTPVRTSPEARLAAAWSAFAAGRHADAARVCDELLRTSPSLRHDALGLKIRVDAAQDNLPAAFADYDRWTSGRADTTLLESVGERVLQQLSGAADVGLRMQAIARLRRAGRRVPPGAEANDINARIASGDAAARDQLLQQIASGTVMPRSAMVEALAEGGASADQLAQLLATRSPEVRAAAIDALGAARTPAALGALAGLRDDPDPYIRLKTTVALARTGDPAALAAARELLSSPAPDVRVTAAEAFQPRTPESVAVVRAALTDPDPVIRLKAARVLAPEEPSLTTVTALLADDNPAIRTEAARAVEERFPEALTVIRQMLNEPDPWIRLYAAGALLHH